MPRPYKTVLVGFGSIAQSLADQPGQKKWYQYSTHAQVLRDHPLFDWQAVVDISDGALAKARDKWGIKETTTRMIDLADPASFEVAVVATHPNVRTEAIVPLTGLRAVLVEKPLADSPMAGEAFIKLCNSRGIHVQVNYQRRADVYFRGLAEGKLSSLIGNVQVVQGIFGGGLANNGSHLIDLVRMLVGEVADVSRHRGNALAFGMRLSGGIVAQLAVIDFNHYREFGLTMWGTKGRLEISHGGLVNHFTPVVNHRVLANEHELASEQRVKMTATMGEAIYGMYDNLALVMEGQANLVSDGINAFRVMEIVDQLQEKVYA